MAVEVGIGCPAFGLKELDHLSDFCVGSFETRRQRVADHHSAAEGRLALVVAGGMPERGLDDLQVEDAHDLLGGIDDLGLGLFGGDRIRYAIVHHRAHYATS